jgi:short-subunit dehydrogenase
VISIEKRTSHPNRSRSGGFADHLTADRRVRHETWLAEFPNEPFKEGMLPMAVTDRPLALVTGASARLGAEFCRQLGAAGHDLVLIARRLDRLEALASELAARHGINATPLAVDLAHVEARDQIAAGLSRQGRDADVLVNNAGFSIPDTFAATPWKRESDMLMTLVYAVAGLAHLVLPAMIAMGRVRIINVASVVGFSPGVAGHTL